MTRPVVIDVIAKDDASATFRKIAAEQALLGKQTDKTSKSFTQSSQNLRKSQLSLISAQERYNKVAQDGKATVGQLASAQSSLIGAQQRVGKATADATRAQHALNHEFDAVKKKSADANRGMGALVTTALALGPALIPIGVVGVGALAGLVPAAGAAGLAFLGLKDAFMSGRLEGSKFSKTVKAFQGEFDKLKTISANAIAPGLNKALGSLKTVFPVLNRTIALFGSQLGTIAANVAPGLVRIFTQLQPLFQTFGDLLVKGSQKFAQWAASTGGIKTFVAYVQANLPTVMSMITSLVTTVGHLVAGFAPFGSVSLAAIKLLSQAINAIPIGVLQVLVPLLTGAVLGLKAFKAADAAATSLGGLSTKLGEAGGIAKGASGFVGTLGKAVGFLGPVGIVAGVGLGILSGIMGRHSKAAQEAAQRTDDLTKALQDGNLRFVLTTQLIKSGAIPAAEKLGISQAVVLGAVQKTSFGLNNLRAGIQTASDKYDKLAAASRSSASQQDPAAYQANAKALTDLRNNLITTSEKVQQAQKDYKAARDAAAEYAKAQGDVSLGAAILSGSSADAAKKLGLTEDAYIAGKIAADKQASSVKATHDAMVVAGDAAGLLKEKLDALNGVALTTEGTTIAFNSSLLNLTTTLKTNGETISLNTQKGLDNRRGVLDSINAAKDNAIAVEGGTRATAANTATYRTNIAAILDHIAKANGDKTATDRQKDAVYQLVLQLSGFNKLPVPPKPISVPTKAAMDALGRLQDKILGLTGKTVVVELDLRSGVSTGGGGTAIGGHPAATGGYIYGPGGPTSDTIPILASSGEFMMKAAAVSKYGLSFMQNLNAQKFAAGGPIIVSMPNPAIVASQASSAESSAANAWARNNMAALASQFGGGGGGGAAPGNISALQAYAYSLFPAYGWGAGALSSLIALWNGESGWNPAAYNASSGATGIPQSLPASKMASAGADYLTNGATQIRWGLSYIASVYGSPTNAYSAWLSRSPHWYQKGAWDVPRTELAGLHKGEMVLPADIAELVRSGVGKGLSPRAIAAAVAEALAGMEFRFDGDGLARLVTSRQTAYAVRGGRR